MSAHPPIAPVPPGTARPFWSVMIPTCEPDPRFLREVLAAVLAQDPGPARMEIALVDDGSTRSDPRACIPPDARTRVDWMRQPQRVGIAANWNACIARARGEWVHILHQDDLIRPGFYARLEALIAACPAAGAAFCRDTVVDGEGRMVSEQRHLRATPGLLEDWVEHIFVGLRLRASALVIRRRTYEALGGFRLDLDYALDWDMWKRIAAAFPLAYEPDALMSYRRHDASASNGFQRSGANIEEIARSIALTEPLLPAAIAAETTRRTRENYTRYAARLGWNALVARDLRTAFAQLRAARLLGSTRTIASELTRQARGALQRAARGRVSVTPR